MANVSHSPIEARNELARAPGAQGYRRAVPILAEREKDKAATLVQQSIRLDGVTIKYHSQTVIDGLNLYVEGGEFVVLLGPSGCGKSTLLGAIAGLTRIAGGRITVGERDVTHMAPGDRRVGMVFQSYALYPHMDVRGNLEFSLKCARMPRATVAAKVAEACRILQLEGFERRRPAQLSGGQRQRVAIGRALVRDVDAFLFDEPLSNLDAKMRAELRVEIKQLHQKLGRTMVYVTHDQVEAMTLADRVVVMRAGRIEQIASPKVIYERPANLFVAGFVGSPTMNFLPADLLAEASVGLEIGGCAFDISGYPFLSKPSSGRSKVIVGVRAEDMVVRGRDNGTRGLRATVTVVEPVGPETLVWLSLDAGTLVVARVPNTREFQPGETVSLDFASERISVFDPATEDRL